VLLGVAGGAGVGLVWGWLLALHAEAAGRRRRAWLAAASALAGAELWLFAGTDGLISGLVAAGVSFGLHTGWRRGLALGR
jgi:hypothetical protein